jgi:hypothetical protein
VNFDAQNCGPIPAAFHLRRTIDGVSYMGLLLKVFLSSNWKNTFQGWLVARPEVGEVL